jgi:hypothetical protein
LFNPIAIKWKNISNFRKIGIIKIPKKLKPTDKSLEFTMKQISLYSQLLEKYPERESYKEEIVLLWASYLESKKTIYPKYKLLNDEKCFSFDYLKWETKRINDLEQNPSPDISDEENLRRLNQSKQMRIHHLKTVWGLSDDYLIDKLFTEIEIVKETK